MGLVGRCGESVVEEVGTWLLEWAVGALKARRIRAHEMLCKAQVCLLLVFVLQGPHEYMIGTYAYNVEHVGGNI